MKKVLIITYYWPPAGGPGVQRVLKFAKYLPEFGWQPIILTVQNGEYPAYDESLFADIPKECKVYKTPAIEPFALYKKFTGMNTDEAIPVATLTEKKTNWKKKLAHWIRLNLFIPDAKIGWIPYAVRAGKHIIRNEKPDIIFSSSPPPTVHLIARSLARWSRIKWVADFRDPWTEIYHYEKQKISNISSLLNTNMERSVLHKSNAVSVVSKAFFADIGSIPIRQIPNGFDESDINQSPKTHNEIFTIRYMGSIKERQYVDNFFDILKELSCNKKFKNSIKLEVIGNVFPNVRDKITEKAIKDIQITFLGYRDHIEALNLISNADALLFIIGKGSRGKFITTGKLFEYIMTKKPIIAIGPIDGEANKIIQATHTGQMFGYSDYENLKGFILTIYTMWQENASFNCNNSIINNYTRRNLTEKLTKLFKV
jgi:glycosyltransferase involved in cell wall biosynthesis